MKSDIGLYVHIPYCLKKCNYCDFISFENNHETIEKYIESICKEIELASEKEKYYVGSIFIGGGTPSILNGRYIEKLLFKIRKCFILLENCEISIEANPGTLTEEKLKIYIEAGVNRLSIGAQAFQDKLLKTLGRIHNSNQIIESYNKARSTGFKNINIDMIFGIPGQTLRDWDESLEILTALNPEHVSCYSLKIEKNTPFYKIYKNNNIGYLPNLLPTEYEERKMYHNAISYLKLKGYKHYEISNFSEKGYECIQNMKYWKCREYMGLGVGAHSYINNKRFKNVSTIEKYIYHIESGKLPRNSIKKLTGNEEITEFIILGLRLIKGVEFKEFKERFGIDIETIYDNEIKKMLDKKLIKMARKGISLTRKGLDFANQVMLEFLI